MRTSTANCCDVLAASVTCHRNAVQGWRTVLRNSTGTLVIQPHHPAQLRNGLGYRQILFRASSHPMKAQPLYGRNLPSGGVWGL